MQPPEENGKAMHGAWSENPMNTRTMPLVLKKVIIGTQIRESQVVSKMRVVNHGEVLTHEREVNAMLDLVKRETERIESRFLEPACGTGNFLVEIIKRKLRVVEGRYRTSQTEYERYAILAMSSIYGIDILKDNVEDCRHRLFRVFDGGYTRLYQNGVKSKCREAAKYILNRNIIWGDALSLKTVGKNAKPIVFSEWSPVNGSMLKRRDFTFHSLLDHQGIETTPLSSDLGEDVFLPMPEKEYPLTHFMEIADANKG